MSRIKSLHIRNFQGVEEEQIEPLDVTLISGGQGEGKTSILQAAEAAFTAQGHRPRLVYDGADKAIILVELDDGRTIERTFRPGKPGTLKVRREGMVFEKPQAILTALFGPYAFNPVAFLENSDADQTAELLALAPIELESAEYQRLGGGVLYDGLDYGAHPLLALDKLLAVKMEERHEFNAGAKAQRAIAERVRSLVPPAFDADAVRETNLKELYDGLAQARAHNTSQAKFEAEIAATATVILTLEKRLAAAMLKRKDLAEQMKPCIDLEPLEASVREFEEQKEHLANFDQAQRATEIAAGQQKQSDALTALIKQIRAKPAELLAGAELPIEGMGIDDEGCITIGGLPIKNLSTSEGIQLALQVARVTTGELELLLVDGLERLDPDSRAELMKQARQDGYQYLITEVTAGELTITDCSDED